MANGRSGVLLTVVDDFPARLAATNPHLHSDLPVATPLGPHQAGPGSPSRAPDPCNRDPEDRVLGLLALRLSKCLPSRVVPVQARIPD